MMERPSSAAGRSAGLAALTLLAWLAAAPTLAPPAGASEPETAVAGYAGKSLTEALLDLESRGLKIVFTSSVVRPEMTVRVEPTATGLRQILDQLLAPHGLVARDGPNDSVVVVPAGGEPIAAASALRGVVRSRADATPLAGATVLLLDSTRRTVSDAAGRFLFVDPGSGPLTLEARAPGFLAGRLSGLSVPAGEQVEVEIALDPTPIIVDELVVTPSRLSLLREEPAATIGLSREEILALPHLGDDFFRAITLLPGASGNDVSAQFHVRGGRRDETQILIDGQELYDAYHLKDFDSAVSFVSPATLSSADLTTGGFSAEYGDRMSGVLDMTTVRPTGRARYRVAAAVLGANLGGAGAFRADRGSWVAELRRGSTDLVGRLLGDEDPVYWDAFVKLDHALGPRHSLRLNFIHSGDELEFEQLVDGERKLFETDYKSTYVWLTHQTILNAGLYFDTAASMARIDRDRRGLELEEDATFTILDRRDLDVVALRQDWSLQLTPKHRLSWGWHLRDFDTVYDYFAVRQLDNPLARIRHDFGVDSRLFQGRFEEEHTSLYLADRLRLADPLTVELGLRWDDHSQTDESRLSPRFNLALAAGSRGVVRLAWGRFNQSQRPYEVQVEDGETGFHPVERSDHRVIGYETLLGGQESAGVALRIELYQRTVLNPRPRYENLYEPINAFPEVEPDRVRITPDRALAEGVEVFLRGRLGQKLGWWMNYTWSSTEDRIGGSWIPRIFDQTHGLNLTFDYRLGKHWRMNLAWRYHTGWPTTPLSLQAREDEEGEVEFVPVLGAINSRRLPDYHRLDLRASRRWQLRSMSVDFFVDAQNLYDRNNPAGFDFEIDEEAGTIAASSEAWVGFLPSAGISIEF